MIFELAHLRSRIENLSFRERTDITDEFLESLPQNTRLYQAYFMGKEEQTTKETVTSDLLGLVQAMNDTERTCLLKISRELLKEKANA
jgi:hypothetical protein